MLLNHPCVMDHHKCTSIAGSLANDRGSNEDSILQNKERCQDHSYSDSLPEQTTLRERALGCQEKSSSWRYRDGEEAAVLKELLEAHLLPKEKGDAKNWERRIKRNIFRRKSKASSASSCPQGFGARQQSQGLHRGSAGACWGWYVRHKQPGRSGGEGGGKEKEIVLCPSLMPKNEKKL